MRANEFLIEAEKTTLLDKIPTNILDDMKYLNELFKKEGYELRMVGGSVRDLLQDKTPKDYDMATTATPDQMVGLAKKYHLQTIPTGLQHGTLTFMMNGEPYEITTLRIDKDTDGRHANVEYTTDWKQDAERRDLTFNAMSMDFNGKIYDYFGGQKDLENGKVKYVGDAPKRIQEDFLRILRYFRFAGRTATPKFDEETLNHIRDNVHGLKNISGERIWAEFSKILSGNHLNEILKAIDQTDTDFAMRMPQNAINNIKHGFPELKHAEQFTKNPATLMAMLLGNRDDVEKIFTNWKFSANEKDLMNFIVDHKYSPLDVESVKDMWTNNKIKKDHIEELLRARGHPELLNQIKNWETPTFPVNGNDLKELGIKPGPEFGKIMKDLESKWKQSDYTLTKDQLLGLIK